MVSRTVHADGQRLGVVGDIVEDIVVWAKTPFAAASDTSSHIVRRRGGSAANVAVAAASLVPTRFMGCVGDDATGHQLAAAMPGVDVCLQTTPVPTGTIVVIVDAAGERHMFPDRGANEHLVDLPQRWLDDVHTLHATAYSLQGGTTRASVVGALKRQRALGRLTSLDASSSALLVQLGVQEFTTMVDEADPAIVFANEDEAGVMGWDVEQASPGRMIIVKHGANPALVRTARGAWRVPAQRLNAADTTGAGDAFAAGVLAYVVAQDLGRDDVRDAEETMARAMANAGHTSAAAWLTRPSDRLS